MAKIVHLCSHIHVIFAPHSKVPLLAVERVHTRALVPKAEDVELVNPSPIRLPIATSEFTCNMWPWSTKTPGL